MPFPWSPPRGTAVATLNSGVYRYRVTMKARLQEEVKLVELAQGTRVKYLGMGVFSAGAGNK